MILCVKCGQTYSSAHCAVCHRSFSGDRAFDRHRTGPYDDRRCLTDAEMQADGKWRITPRGLTHSVPMPKQAKGRLRDV